MPPKIASYAKSGKGTSSPIVVASSGTTTSFITTMASKVSSDVAFDSHHEGSSVSGVMYECSAPHVASFVVKLGASLVATSGTGCVTGEMTVAATAVGN